MATLFTTISLFQLATPLEWTDFVQPIALPAPLLETEAGTDCIVTGWGTLTVSIHTDKNENKIFLIYGEIQSGAVAKSYVRKGFLIYEEMRKYLTIYEEAVSHI
jgi:hypothetical protein